MQVKDLIFQLKQYDQDAEVVVSWRTDDDYLNIEEVQYNENGDVELVKG